MRMYIIDVETGAAVSVKNRLMTEAGLDWRMGFEDFGLQSDGTPVIFDRCGNFGYLDGNKYHVVVDMSGD